jgi:hypothetical protein
MRPVSDQELIDDLVARARFLGYRPTYKEVGKPWTKYGRATFEQRFGSFTKAIEVAGLMDYPPAPRRDWLRRA